MAVLPIFEHVDRMCKLGEELSKCRCDKPEVSGHVYADLMHDVERVTGHPVMTKGKT